MMYVFIWIVRCILCNHFCDVRLTVGLPAISRERLLDSLRDTDGAADEG